MSNIRSLMQATWDETRGAIRVLRHSPGFTICALLLLTATIGAVTSLGAAAYELLIGSLPYGRPNQLVTIWSELPNAGYARAPLAGPEVFDLRTRGRKFAGIAAITASSATLGLADDPIQIPIGTVTHNFFDVLEAPPLHGRYFTADDEGNGKPSTVVISWSLWQSRFGGDASIVGKKISLDGKPAQVIGVMPSRFRMVFPADASIPENIGAWLPFRYNLDGVARHRYFLRVIGRLQEDQGPEVAASEVAGISNALMSEFPGYASSGRRFIAVSLRKDLAQPVRMTSYALICAGLFLVLLGYLNLSGLWVARTVGRQKEYAICQALGATVTRMRNSTLLQAALLSSAGCVLGLGAGLLGLKLLKWLRPPSLARIDHASLSWTIVLAVVAIVIGSTLFLAAVSRTALTPLDSSHLIRTRAGSALRYRIRAALTVAQVSLALIFVICSALFTRTLIQVLHTDPGFRPENAFTFRYSINLTGLDYGKHEEISLLNRRLNDAIASIPGVEWAGTVSHLPFDHLPNWAMYYWPEGGDRAKSRSADFRPVSPALLKAMGLRLSSGRFFQESDSLKTQNVAVVDRLLVARTWPGQDPLGKVIAVETWPGTPPLNLTVIGVVDHIRHKNIEAEVREQVYTSVRQYPYGPYAFVIRTGVDSSSLTPAIRQRAREIDPRIAVWDFRPMSAYYDIAVAERRFTAILVGLFTAAALLVASIGVYGLLAYIVVGRRGEFGIRLALGAPKLHVVRSVAMESLTWALMGIALGVVLLIPIVTSLSTVLYGVKPYDPISWTVGILVLITVLAFASFVPAIRAGRTEPGILMRYE